MILPSSNTVVEPTCIAMLGSREDLSIHFARFKLTEVTVDDPAKAYYDSGVILEAAKLLADARCDVITWNGSAGGVVGLDRDRRLIADIERATGTPATTSSLAILDAFRARGVKRFAMITLNPPAMNAVITRHFAAEGFECVFDTSRTDIADNYAMAAVAPERIAAMAVPAAQARPDALIVYGTNTRGAPIVRQLETALGIMVIDSVAAGVWGAMRRAGVTRSGLEAWGSLFAQPQSSQ